MNLAGLPDTKLGVGQVIFHDPLADAVDVKLRQHQGRPAPTATGGFDSKRMAGVSQAGTRAAAKAAVSRDLARLIAERAAITAGTGH